MRRLGFVLVLICTACPFDPDPREDTDGEETGEPTTGTSVDPTLPTTNEPSTTTMDPSTTTMDPSTTTMNPSTTTVDPSDTDPDPACAAEELCIEAAPPGWDGPGLQVVGNGNVPPECGGSYPLGDVGGLVDVAVDPPLCDCECEPMADAACDPVQIVYHDGLGCGSGQGANSLADGECGSFFIGQGIESVIADFPSAAPGQICGSPVVDETVPPLDIINPTSLCLPESFGSSCGENSTCLPQTEISTYCIAREGDVPCPADSAYDQRTVIYQNIDDQRGCGECSCGALLGQCAGNISVHSSGNCGGGALAFDLGVCENFPDPEFVSARYNQTEAQFACEAGQVSPTGAVDLLDPTTFCCADF